MKQSTKRPNIIFVFTDQQSASMMSCTGNDNLKTPVMDKLAAEGVRFDRAYCTNPVCLPSRFSMWTGRFPSYINIRENDMKGMTPVPEHVFKEGLGYLFKEAGYEAVYGGKIHLPFHIKDLGFDYICENERDKLADVCVDYILQPHDKPYFMVASFINPHDICYMAIRDNIKTEHDQWIIDRGTVEVATLDEALTPPEGVDQERWLKELLPELPSNYEPTADEPEAIATLLDQCPFKRQAREEYTEEQWRLHRWAFCRLTEKVDAQIGRLMTALEKSGEADNTIVIFSSDHGDMDSAHRMEHKDNLHEEACLIPLVVKDPGVNLCGEVDTTHLVSNGLDLFPTLCDYAGIEPPEGLIGSSFRPLTTDTDVTWRKSLAVESEFGDMVLTDRYKYMHYFEGKRNEQLHDRKIDPGEMQNFRNDPAYTDILEEHRKLYVEHFGDAQ